ncbi:MAG: PqqD family protein [Anaerolineae bacterium]|jgi:hypothetical protein|nr:PqqD family protein [Anaerolineae bacterium]
MPNLNDVLRIAPGVVSRESDGELVVVLPEQGKFVVLNGTGADVFQSVDGQRSLAEIAAALSERYDVPLEQTQTDVLAFAQKLLDRGAVSVQGE